MVPLALDRARVVVNRTYHSNKSYGLYNHLKKFRKNSLKIYVKNKMSQT